MAGRYSLLISLLMLDGALVALHVAGGPIDRVMGGDLFDTWSLESRFGLASTWNYGKLLLAGAVLFWAWRMMRDPALGCLAAVAGLLFLDDFYELHDRIGIFVGTRMDWEFLAWLAPQDRGELAGWAVLAVAVFGSAGVAWRVASAGTMPFVRRFVGVVVALAVLGVGVDTAHGLGKAALFPENSVVDQAFIVLEEGIELGFLTLLLWVTLAWVAHLASENGASGAAPAPASRPVDARWRDALR